jgi:beta-glucosidase
VQVAFAPGVQLKRKFPSPFDALAKEKPPAAWTESQAAEEFNKAVEVAKQSDIAIMFLGESQVMSGESASRDTLDLPGRQEDLLEAVVATGKPVVLVLLNGRPLNITWASRHVPAILEAWYPGTSGGKAISNLLAGVAGPGGKLPFTWPRNVGQVPIFYAHNTTHQPENQGKRYWNEESTPLFPFGFGLSYTSFAFDNLRVSKPVIGVADEEVVSVDVENTGAVTGDEVIQLYIHQTSGTSSRPVRELKGFKRITLAAHQHETVTFTITKSDRTYWSAVVKGWVADSSKFDVWVGDDSTAPHHAEFEVSSLNAAR